MEKCIYVGGDFDIGYAEQTPALITGDGDDLIIVTKRDEEGNATESKTIKTKNLSLITPWGNDFRPNVPSEDDKIFGGDNKDIPHAYYVTETSAKENPGLLERIKNFFN